MLQRVQVQGTGQLPPFLPEGFVVVTTRPHTEGRSGRREHREDAAWTAPRDCHPAHLRQQTGDRRYRRLRTDDSIRCQRASIVTTPTTTTTTTTTTVDCQRCRSTEETDSGLLKSAHAWDESTTCMPRVPKHRHPPPPAAAAAAAATLQCHVVPSVGGIAADNHASYRPGEFQSNHWDARKKKPPASHTTTRMRRNRRTQQDAGYKRHDATTVSDEFLRQQP
jgi:hypothetical protein